MNKKLIKLLLTFVLVLLSTRTALADDLSLKVSQPKSPTNQNSFNLNFVALDQLSREVVVRCYKKGPLDSAFSQFGSDYNLIAGGNSDNCFVGSSTLSGEGTYQFYVTATAGSDSVTSQTVSVEYLTSGPGTPVSYGKEKVSSCNYLIKFTTASDGGKTVKVELYRSDQKSYSADTNSVVASQVIGSGANGEFNNSIPDCNKNYYYSLRAFDAAGNGSGLVGDSVTVTTVDNGTTTSSTDESLVAGGALVVSESQVGNSQVESGTSETPEEKSAENSDSAAAGAVEGASTSSPWPKRLLLLMATVLLFSLYVYKKSRQTPS